MYSSTVLSKWGLQPAEVIKLDAAERLISIAFNYSNLAVIVNLTLQDTLFSLHFIVVYFVQILDYVYKDRGGGTKRLNPAALY